MVGVRKPVTVRKYWSEPTGSTADTPSAPKAGAVDRAALPLAVHMAQFDQPVPDFVEFIEQQRAARDGHAVERAGG